MPIQFRCVACSQPIEVDDALADQFVTCPYCQKVVTAPAASDPAVNQSAPRARGASGPQQAFPSSGAAPIPTPMSASTGLEPLAYSSLPPVPSESNRLAWVSLILASIAIVCFIVVNVIAISIVGSQAAQLKPDEANKILMDKIQDSTALAVLLVVSGLGACFLPVASAICAIVALIRRVPPRWPAVLALIIVIGWFLISCSGFYSYWSMSKPMG